MNDKNVTMHKIKFKALLKVLKGDDFIAVHLSRRKKALIRKMEAETGVSVHQICSDAIDEYFNLKGVR